MLAAECLGGISSRRGVPLGRRLWALQPDLRRQRYAFLREPQTSSQESLINLMIFLMQHRNQMQ